MAGGEPLDVDFVVDGPGPAAEDETLEPPPPRNRRRQLIVGLVIAALLIAGLTARAVRSGSSSPAAARPSSGASTLSSLTPSAPAVAAPLAGATPRRPPTNPADCPEADDGQAACSRDDSLSAAVTAAVRAHFPGAVINSGFSEQVRDTGSGPGGLWYRQVRATAGALTIVVEVRQRTPADRDEPATGDDNGTSTDVTVVRVSTTLTVEVRAYGRSGLPQQLAAATALADDQRLRAS